MLAGLLLAAAAAPQGAVASSEAHATAAGAEILAAGGNAVDAAVATGFALAVTYPVAGNLGGGGFLLHRTASGEAFFLDFREVAPAAAHAAMYLDEEGHPRRRASLRGWLAAGVPGSVPGMAEAHRRWGRLPWERLLAPAIRLAEEGFPVSVAESESLGRATDLRRDPLAARRFYLPDGAPLPPGALLRQPELAATLRAIAAEGDAAFRSGTIAEELAAASAAGGGILGAADLRDYRPELRPVQRIRWKGLTVLAPTAPSSGGLFLAQCLPALERWPLRTWGWGDGRTAMVLGETTARAFADRNRWLGDPAGFDFDPAALHAPAHLARRFAGVAPGRWTPPTRLGEGAPPSERVQTTHYSVVDSEGAACSVTTTLNGAYGAQVMAPGGFLMNNEMDDFAAAPGRPNQFGLVQGAYNAVAPGRRPLSSMAPVIVEKDGRVDAVLGSPGGPTILTTVLQVLLNRYVFGMRPERAVAAPRFHRQDRPPQVQYEAGRFDGPARLWLDQAGQPLRLRGGIGDVNAVFRRGGGWCAVADPRRGGAAMVVERELAAENR